MRLSEHLTFVFVPCSLGMWMTVVYKEYVGNSWGEWDDYYCLVSGVSVFGTSISINYKIYISNKEY